MDLKIKDKVAVVTGGGEAGSVKPLRFVWLLKDRKS